METRITVADGQTLVLGGILQTDYNQSTTRTPFVSSLPFVGRLFRHRIVRDDQQELLVFVTPVIVQTPAATLPTVNPAAGALFNRGVEQ
jgi:type IV pilus assembly protein PilQ